jgi:hypothetical protein
LISHENFWPGAGFGISINALVVATLGKKGNFRQKMASVALKNVMRPFENKK